MSTTFRRTRTFYVPFGAGGGGGNTAVGNGFLTLGASGLARARSSGAFALSLSASGTAVNPNVLAGLAALALSASASIQAAVSGSTSLTLGASGVLGTASSTASLTLGASGLARSTGAGTASLTLGAFSSLVGPVSVSYPGALPGRERVGITRPGSTFSVATVSSGSVSGSASLTLGASGAAAAGSTAATITNHNLTGSTANTTSYTTTSFTPVAGELLAVVVHATASVATDTTLTASANSLTFTQVGTLVHTLSGHITVVFVANQRVPASPTVMTTTFSCASDAATGAFISVNGVSGLTKTGLTAIKQTAFSPNIAANQAWTVVFPAATTTTNPLLGFVAHVGGAIVTPPAGWVEMDQPADQVTPGQGFETAKSDSGHTTTTFTWTSSLGSPTNNTRANVGAVEFDAT